MDPRHRIVYVAPPGRGPCPSFRRTLSLAQCARGRVTVLASPGGWRRGRGERRPAPGGQAWQGEGARAGVPVDVRPLPEGASALAVLGAVPADASLVIEVAGRRADGWSHAQGRLERALLKALPCSMWHLPPGFEGPAQSVVAALALDEERAADLDRLLLRVAATLASTEGAQLHVVHAWTLIGESILTCPVRGIGGARGRRLVATLGRERAARLAAFVESEGLGQGATCTCRKGPVAGVVRDVARHARADVVVVGFRPRTGLFGSVRKSLAERVLDLSGPSLLAVREEGPAPLGSAHEMSRSA